MHTLTIYSSGAAILRDNFGASVWTSDGDEDFLAEFEDVLDVDDADDVLDYLEEAGVLTADEAEDCEILDNAGADDDHADDDDPDFDEDDEDDEPGGFFE